MSEDPSVREKIMDRFKELIESVSGVEYVVVDEPTPVDIDSVPVASCWIHPGPEVRVTDNRAPVGYETWLWEVIIEVWCYYDDSETLLKAIHKKVFDDYTLDGLAVRAVRSGVDVIPYDVERKVKVMIIPFSVLYRHQNGTM